MTEKVAVPQLLSAALQKSPPSLVIYASYQVFTLFFVVITASVSFLPGYIPICLATPSLPSSACQTEQALSLWEVYPPSFTFPVVFGEQCCVACFGLHCRQLKWWFVSIQVQTGFWSRTRDGERTKTVWHRACFAGRLNWMCHTSSMFHLMLVENCESPLCICRNWSQQKWQV